MANEAHNADTDIAKIASDIQALKKDLAQLVEHIKTGATDTVSAEANRIYDNIASEGQRQAAALAQSVEEKPLTSVLIAFGIGFIAARVLSR